MNAMGPGPVSDFKQEDAPTSTSTAISFSYLLIDADGNAITFYNFGNGDATVAKRSWAKQNKKDYVNTLVIGQLSQRKTRFKNPQMSLFL